RTSFSKAAFVRGSCRASVTARYTCSGNPAAIGSSRATTCRMIPDSFSRRTRCSVAAGDSPISRASSTLVRSASACSSARIWTSTSSSEIAITPNNIWYWGPTVKLCPARVDDCGMRNTRTFALLALTTAGVLWGTTVPMTKVALGWLGPGWLAVVRFAIAALLLAIPARRQLRAALTPSILGWGAAGFGVVLVVQNAGVARTSVSHGSLLNASIPILVAIIAAVSGKSRIGALSWSGFALATAGVIVVASGDGGSATLTGDGLVLASVGLCAAFVAAQPRLLAGRNPMAVTAVQFAAGAVVALPFALGFDGPLAAPTSTGPVLAVAGL